MVKGRSIPEGQELPEEKGPEQAGEVFAEVYATAVKNMHPEDAVSVAEGAASSFLESIGATRPAPEYVEPVRPVKIVNSRELAGEIVKILYGSNPSQATIESEHASNYSSVVVFRHRPNGAKLVLAEANVPGARAGAQHVYFVELEDGCNTPPLDLAVSVAEKLAAQRDGARGGEAMP
ncbi:hypothetical protein GBA65_14915 [Rubrobacter marinus]|uniref:Uncharacterized protein n=1 Tax=Rubrobacter marinus TaxID=2653852 RepID=A0A6G8PZK0_9ACTN|nr:hypothetical protein [Rubrobacter marinus]QIN79598.1 hypothetical protein GBA65_14915 [Rubrobacter marinus]